MPIPELLLFDYRWNKRFGLVETFHGLVGVETKIAPEPNCSGAL